MGGAFHPDHRRLFERGFTVLLFYFSPGFSPGYRRKFLPLQ